jgi:hypothetical protein
MSIKESAEVATREFSTQLTEADRATSKTGLMHYTLLPPGSERDLDLEFCHGRLGSITAAIKGAGPDDFTSLAADISAIHGRPNKTLSPNSDGVSGLAWESSSDNVVTLLHFGIASKEWVSYSLHDDSILRECSADQ